MAQFNERSKIIVVEPFGYRVEVIVTNDFAKSAQKRVDQIGEIELKDNACAFTCTRPHYSHVHLFLPKRADMGSIAHESVHVVSFIMKDIGASFEEEIWAYHIGELADKIATFSWYKKKKGKNK